MNAEFIRLVDSISRDKNIEKEFVFLDLEAAMVSAGQPPSTTRPYESRSTVGPGRIDN